MPVKARPTIVFINRIYPPQRGATGRLLRDLAKGFAKSGWHVTILTTGSRAETQQDGSITIRRVKARVKSKSARSYMWIWLKLFFAALRLPRQALLVTMTDPPMLVVAGRIVAGLKRMPHIHWCHDLYPDLLPAMHMRAPRPVMGLLKMLSRWGMKGCDRIIVIGRCMAQQITDNGIVPAKVTVIPNWPDLEISRKDRDAPKTAFLNHLSAAGSKLRHTDDAPKFRVLYAGNIGRTHPMKPILRAAEKLSDHPEIEFVFVGDSRGHDHIAWERDKLGLQNIRLLPYQPAGQLREVLESGDLHIVSMSEEAAGLLVPCKFYSSLAVGRPCVFMGSKSTEIGQVIDDFHAGQVVPQGDPETLAQTILNYRMNSDDWFTAQKGSAEAGDVFFPKQSIREWIARAKEIVTTRSV